MIPSRTVLLLLAICSIVAMVTSAAFSNGEELEDDGSLANLNILEDMLTILNDKEKKRVCTDKKSSTWCRLRNMFFHDCQHKTMKRNCKATCHFCRG